MLRPALFALTTALLAAQTPAPESPKPVAQPEAAPIPAPQATEAPKAAEAPKAVPAPVRPKTAPAHTPHAQGHQGHAHAPGSLPEVSKDPAENPVMARVGKTLLRKSDFDLFLSLALNPQQRMQVDSTQTAKEEYKRQFLEFKLLEAKARKMKLDQGEDFMRRRSMMEMQILIQELMQKEGEQLKKQMLLPDEEVKPFYDQNQETFRTPESFNARHILVAVKGGPSNPEKGLSEEEAKAKVAKLQEELKAGKSFADLAKEHSDDPGSKGNGGLYENVSFGSFAPEFEAAVRKQDIGKVGEPVKTPFGYHLIVAEKVTPSEVQPFEKVKDQVRQRAQMAKQEKVFKAFLDGIKQEIGFVTGPEAEKGAAEPAKKVSKTPAKKVGDTAKAVTKTKEASK